MSSKKHHMKRDAQLGMPFSTANNRLKKRKMFQLVQMAKLDVCYRCSKKITTAEELSIDHRKDWLDIDPILFWDINNVTFSHMRCNISITRHRKKK